MRGKGYDCGVPLEECSGAATHHHQSGISAPRRGYKIHASLDSARRCQKRWVAARNAGRAEGDPILLPPGKPQIVRRMHKKDGRLKVPVIRG